MCSTRRKSVARFDYVFNHDLPLQMFFQMQLSILQSTIKLIHSCIEPGPCHNTLGLLDYSRSQFVFISCPQNKHLKTLPSHLSDTTEGTHTPSLLYPIPDPPPSPRLESLLYTTFRVCAEPQLLAAVTSCSLSLCLMITGSAHTLRHRVCFGHCVCLGSSWRALDY